MSLVRLGIWGVAAPIAAGCATGGGSADSGAALDRACGVEDCFLEREVRDFEVLNSTTLIVYVGSQRCPFQVELEGTFCDMTMAPQVSFRTPEERRIDQLSRQDPLDPRDVFEQDLRRQQQLGRDMAMTRICSNDRVEVDGGVFTEPPVGSPAGSRRQCVIRSVAALTDDQLVELYVDRGVVAPPPPIGRGEIKVEPEEQHEDGADRPETPAVEDGSAAVAPETASGTAARAEP